MARIEDARRDARERTEKNIPDPFSTLLTAASFEVSSKSQLDQIQSNRTITQNISIALGRFHQEILGSLEGWVNHDAGYDVKSSSRKILAEIKNKHNTMNASNKEKVEADLDTAIRQHGKGWEGYLVIIIPRKASMDKTQLTKRDVFEVSGQFFYYLATEEKNAMRQLFDAVLLNVQTQFSLPGDVLDYCMQAKDSILPDAG